MGLTALFSALLGQLESTGRFILSCVQHLLLIYQLKPH